MGLGDLNRAFADMALNEEAGDKILALLSEDERNHLEDIKDPQDALQYLETLANERADEQDDRRLQTELAVFVADCYGFDAAQLQSIRSFCEAPAPQRQNEPHDAMEELVIADEIRDRQWQRALLGDEELDNVHNTVAVMRAQGCSEKQIFEALKAREA